MKRVVRRLYQSVINPPSDEALHKAWSRSEGLLPVIWLLGKTGAGKSTIVQSLTDQDHIEIGNGFRPCTLNSAYYDYPEGQPILRFLDTRGLGEANYDANEDLRIVSGKTHAVLVVLRVSDSEQQDVISALRQVRKQAKYIKASEVLVVHTCLAQIDNFLDRQRAMAYNHAQIEKALGKTLDGCGVELVESYVGKNGSQIESSNEELKVLLGEKIPAIRLWLLKRTHTDAEHQNFERFRSEVLWYAGAAAATDALPVVGLVSVPGIQGKMLHSLAQRYDIVWDNRSFAEFVGALGLGSLARYMASLLSRQAAKLVPVYGQSAGAVLASSITYAGTYALGRAACSYLYHKKTNKPITKTALKNTYKKAMQDGKQKIDKE